MTVLIALSLETLRSQVDALWPKRSKVSDGWVGDAAHQTRKSDHNPNGAGVVQAIDITHDPASGCDSYALAEALRQSKDKRIKYVISNGHIFSSTMSPWAWRPYNGANKHAKHVHISVSDDPVLYDEPRAWVLDGADQVVDTEPQADWRPGFAKLVLDWESARDDQGRLKVHRPDDGTFEVGGVWSRAHPQLANELLNLLNTGRHKEAEDRVLKFIVEFTEPVRDWVDDDGCELFLRDCLYNRGEDGAARIVQMALGVDVDGEVGPQTKAAYKRDNPNSLLQALRGARERYEVQKYGRREKLWAGLVNRWNKALAAANALQEKDMPDPVVVPDVKEFTDLEVAQIQQRLRELNYFTVGKVDGKWGASTVGALASFQATNGLPVTVDLTPVWLDDKTRLKLLTASPKPIDPDRANTTADDLDKQGSTTVRKALKINWAQWGQYAMAGITALAFAFANYQTVELPAVLRIALQFIPGVPAFVLPLIMFGLAVYTHIKASGIIQNRVVAERIGLHNGEPMPAETPKAVVRVHGFGSSPNIKPVETKWSFPFRTA